MTRKRLMFGAAAAGLTAAALLLGGALRDSSSASPAPLRTAATGAQSGDTAALVAELQAKVRANRTT